MEDILKTCLHQKHLDLGSQNDAIRRIRHAHQIYDNHRRKIMPYAMPPEYSTFLTWAKFSSQAPIASDTSIIFSPTIFEMPKSVKSFTA